MINLNLNKNKKYLLACSYGPDSIALFWRLLNQKYNFIVCHVNYKTRDLSDFEEESLKKLCESKGILFFSATYVKKKGNFEKEAREFRYTFFNEIFLKEKCDYVLTAHHMDDSIETYLMQQNRNIYPMYYGILSETKLKNMILKRPLLEFEKKELLNYCDLNNYKYSIDITNFDNSYERNNIRNNIISRLTRVEKEKLVNEINSKNNQLKDLYKKFDKSFIKNNIVKWNNKFENIEELQRFLFYFGNKNNINISDFDFKSIINSVLNKNFNTLFRSKNQNLLILDNEYLILTSEEKINQEYIFDVNTINNPFKVAKEFINSYKIKPLKLYKEIKVLNYIKKTKRFFIDTKMPLSLRYIWPCVVNQNDEIIFTPRYRKKFVVNNKVLIEFNVDELVKFFY